MVCYVILRDALLRVTFSYHLCAWMRYPQYLEIFHCKEALFGRHRTKNLESCPFLNSLGASLERYNNEAWLGDSFKIIFKIPFHSVDKRYSVRDRNGLFPLPYLGEKMLGLISIVEDQVHLDCIGKKWCSLNTVISSSIQVQNCDLELFNGIKGHGWHRDRYDTIVTKWQELLF